MYSEFKQLLKHSVIYGFGMYLGKVVGFFLIPVYTRFLTPSDYGVLELLNLTSYVTSILLCVGLSSAVFRFYYKYGEGENNQVVSTAVIFMLFMSCAALLLINSLAGVISSSLFKGENYVNYVRLIAVSNFFDLLTVIPSAYVRVKKKSVFYTAISITNLVLALALNICFVVFWKMGIAGILWSGIISALYMAMAYVIFTIRNAGLKISLSKLKELLAFGIPLMPESLFLFGVHFSNRFLLQHFATTAEVGLFSLGYKFSMILPLFISRPFDLIWSASKFEIIKKERGKLIYARILTYFFLITAAFFLLLSLLSREIIQFSTTPAFYQAYRIIPLLTMGFLFMELSGIIDIGILLKNKTYLKSVSAALAFIVNFTLNWLLIPRWGIAGAALASLLTFVLLFCVQFFLANRLYTIPFEWSRIGKIVLAVAVVYSTSLLIRFPNIYISLVFKLFLLLVFGVLLFVFRLFAGSEIKRAVEIIKKFKNILSRFYGREGA